MNFVLVGLYCGPLLTLIPPLTRTLAKKRVSGNRFSDFRVSGGPPVFAPFFFPYALFINIVVYNNCYVALKIRLEL